MLAWSWPLARAALFRLDAEHAHELTLAALSRAPRLIGRSVSGGLPHPSQAVTVAGLQLAGPVGLAAGLDKDARAIPAWEALGFGFIEVGTVTAHAQEGNPRPRLFRIPEERALLNRMGFNNQGSEVLAENLRALRASGRWPKVPVGANLGKSKITPLEEAAEDYRTSAKRLAGLADYFTVNVSSPNTPGLRKLQDPGALGAVIDAVLEEVGTAPTFLKLAPDLEDDALADAVELAVKRGVAGLIATNTTIRRDMLARGPEEAGGLSGAPLRALALQKVGVVLDVVGGRVPVIGVGGVSSADHAQQLLGAGCAAVQLYSGLIFEGPALPGRIHQALRA